MTKTEFTKKDIIDLLSDNMQVYAPECTKQFEDDDKLSDSDIVVLLRSTKAAMLKGLHSLYQFARELMK